MCITVKFSYETSNPVTNQLVGILLLYPDTCPWVGEEKFYSNIRLLHWQATVLTVGNDSQPLTTRSVTQFVEPILLTLKAAILGSRI
jgi:hypothetical protein